MAWGSGCLAFGEVEGMIGTWAFGQGEETIRTW